MRGAISPLAHYFFMAWCLVIDRDNFTLTLRIRKGQIMLARWRTIDTPTHNISLTIDLSEDELNDR